MIDEDRCMRCGLCEWVCPTDQERYGNQKAIVNGTGYLSIQSSVYDRSDNVLDLERLTYHSRVLRLELNSVMGTKTPEPDIAINDESVAGIRLSGAGGDVPLVHRRPPSGTGMRVKRLMLKAYAPFWLKKRGLPLRPERLEEEARPHSDSESWPSFREAAGRGRRH
jgi:ferredoxin